MSNQEYPKSLLFSNNIEHIKICTSCKIGSLNFPPSLKIIEILYFTGNDMNQKDYFKDIILPYDCNIIYVCVEY